MFSSPLKQEMELQFVSLIDAAVSQDHFYMSLCVASGEVDFEARSVDLTFGPGNTEQEVMITIIDDLRLEPDERFNSIVTLTVADPAVSLNPAEAAITIIDNDSK